MGVAAALAPALGAVAVPLLDSYAALFAVLGALAAVAAGLAVAAGGRTPAPVGPTGSS